MGRRVSNYSSFESVRYAIAILFNYKRVGQLIMFDFERCITDKSELIHELHQRNMRPSG